jgi:transposase
MQKIYRIQLEADERSVLEKLSRKRNAPAHKVLKARALLLCDEGQDGGGRTDPEVMRETGIKFRTLQRLRQRCCEVGPLEALERKKQDRPSRLRKLDGPQHKHLKTIARSRPPDGHSRWTLRLLAHKLEEQELVDTISYETVREALKRMNMRLG